VKQHEDYLYFFGFSLVTIYIAWFIFHAIVNTPHLPVIL